MIVSLMLLLSNTSLLGSAHVATAEDRRKNAGGYVTSGANLTKQDAPAATETVHGPDEWPFAL